MPIIRINAHADTPVLHDNPNGPDLRRTLSRRDSDAVGPVIVMIHGFKYQPGHPTACPHKRLFATHPGPRSSWPRGFGFGLMGPKEGLGIAFGWNARSTLPTARLRSQDAGRALTVLINDIKSLWPTRPVHMVSHSLGSEVIFEALQHLPAHSVSRIILLTAASFRGRANLALASPAGRTSEIINITSRENDLFDFLCEQLPGFGRCGDITLGAGLDAANSITIQLDCSETLEHLSRLGRPIEHPRRRICHWSVYRRRGTLRLYSDLMRYPERFSLEVLRQGLPPNPTPRWSRLLDIPVGAMWRRRPDLFEAYTSARPRSATT